MKRKVIKHNEPDFIGLSIIEVFEFLEQYYGFDFGKPYKVERIKNGIVICQECDK